MWNFPITDLLPHPFANLSEHLGLGGASVRASSDREKCSCSASLLLGCTKKPQTQPSFAARKHLLEALLQERGRIRRNVDHNLKKARAASGTFSHSTTSESLHQTVLPMPVDDNDFSIKIIKE